MPKVLALVYKEQAKQFHKIPGIKFKLFCLHSFTKSVSILWLALIVDRVYQHFSNANISVKQICLGGGRGNVHFIPKKEDYSWVKLFNLIFKKTYFQLSFHTSCEFLIWIRKFSRYFQKTPKKAVEWQLQIYLVSVQWDWCFWISLCRTNISFLFTSLVLQGLIIINYEII